MENLIVGLVAVGSDHLSVRGACFGRKSFNRRES